MFLSKGRTRTTNGAETKGRDIQGLPYLGIHHNCRHQPDIDGVFKRCLLTGTSYEGSYVSAGGNLPLVPHIRQRSGKLVRKLGEKLKVQGELKPHWKNNIYYQDHPMFPVSRP